MPLYEFGGIPQSGNGEHVMVLSDFMDRDFSHHLLSFHGIAVYDFFFFFFFRASIFSGKKYKYISKPSCRVYNDVIAHVTAMVGFAKSQGRTVISTGTHKPGGR